MKIMLLGFWLLLCFKCLAQEPFVYQSDLQAIHDKDSVASFLRKIEAIHQDLTTKPTPAAPFSRGHYQLLYYRNSGWNERYPEHRSYFDAKFSARKSVGPVTAQELLAKFGFGLKDSTAILNWPVIMQETSPDQHSLPPVLLNQQYFILCRIHSYPHGNQTSWYYERTYYFRRVE